MNQENNTKKDIAEMTDKEILRQQLELLAERSKQCMDEELNGITTAMVTVCITLANIF